MTKVLERAARILTPWRFTRCAALRKCNASLRPVGRSLDWNILVRMSAATPRRSRAMTLIMFVEAVMLGYALERKAHRAS